MKEKTTIVSLVAHKCRIGLVFAIFYYTATASVTSCLHQYFWSFDFVSILQITLIRHIAEKY